MILNHEEVMTGKAASALVLHMERGGNFLGVVREWIKCKARNGCTVEWGSGEILQFSGLSVSELETLAAQIAASAANETRDNIVTAIRAEFEGGGLTGLDAKQTFGDNPVIIAPVVLDHNKELDHRHCIGAHSWQAGGMVFGQGKFNAWGMWEHGCVKCNHKYQVNQ